MQKIYYFWWLTIIHILNLQTNPNTFIGRSLPVSNSAEGARCPISPIQWFATNFGMWHHITRRSW